MKKHKPNNFYVNKDSCHTKKQKELLFEANKLLGISYPHKKKSSLHGGRVSKTFKNLYAR